MTRLRTFLIATGALAGACGLPGDEPEYGQTVSEVAVSAYQSSGCSTSVVVGLSKQIADEIACMAPSLLTKFDPTANIRFSSNAVLPYLHSAARTNLMSVGASRTIQINSAFRTVAQQYLLYRWYQQKRCGITAAATPGRSNHQSGRALDIQNYSALISPMSAKGWKRTVPNDPVHFDHPSSPDIRGKDVLAFQRLWNRNNPSAKIAEDGVYGPQTEGKLKLAPATGFATGATCGQREAANIVMVEGPDKLAPGTRAHYALTVENTTTADWPDATRLLVAGGTSELYDSVTWTSPAEVGQLGAPILAGTYGVIDVEVAAPMVTEETPLFTQLALTHDGQTFGTVNLALIVTPNGDEGTSSEADAHGHGDDDDDLHGHGEHESELVQGGCSAGGGAGGAGWALALLPLVIVVRRRRA